MAKRLAQNWEHHTDCVISKFGLHIGGNLIHSGVIALRTGHYGLRYRDDILFTQCETRLRGCGQNTIHNDLGDVVSLADDRGPDTPGYSAD